MNTECPRIHTIGFEGPHRVGKGTQSGLLQAEFLKNNIPCLIVRGDGSRPGTGEFVGDPVSKWWQEMNVKLRAPDRQLEDWNLSSYKLARELVVWKNRTLPNFARAISAEYGVLIVDRSILSRTLVPREQNVENVAENLYLKRQKGRTIYAGEICPDIIINLVATKDTLLGRLDQNDPKYEFRKRLLEERYDWYLNAVEFIPPELQSRVIKVDAERTIPEVLNDIMVAIHERLSLNE